MTKLRVLLIIFLAAWSPTILRAQQRPPVNGWEGEIKKFEEADARAFPPPGAVLFVGSSSIRLWESLAEDFAPTKVINRGFGGSEIADSTLYLTRIIVPYRPRLVVLYAGDNDLANGKTPAEVFADYQSFVAGVRRRLPTTPIAFISIKPSPARAALLPRAKAANEMIKDYAARQKNLRYIDVFSPMLGADGQPRPELFGPDELHLNEAGYDLWKSVIAPFLREGVKLKQ